MPSPVKFTTIGDLLKGTPFDRAFNLGGTLTEEVFFEDFYVEPPAMKTFSSELLEKLDNPHLTHVVTLISGYAGNGKTTFLRAFIRNHDEYKHEYYAASEWTKPEPGRKASSSPDRVASMMKRQIRDSPGVQETLAFVAANCDVLKREDFISSRLHHFLRERRFGEDDGSFVEQCTDEFELEDAFAVLFIHLFKRSEPGRKTIVYFDNLDIAPIEYIVSDFWEHFHYALSSAERLATDPLFGESIDFRNDFRFVFCLRDTNDAVLNAHLAGRLDIARLSFTVPFDSDFYSQVVGRRLDYLETHFPDGDVIPAGKFSTCLRAVLEDEYFHHVFMRLYNCDYRAAVTAIVEVLTDLKLQPRVEITYGLRGIILFGLIGSLLQNNFLGDYREHARRKDGWCYIDRVMLTVLINRSSYRRGIREPDRSHPYGLYNLVTDLKPLYDVGSVLGSVTRCFLNHQRGWVHLVTVMNAQLDDRNAFVTVSRLAHLFVQVTRDPGNAAVRNDLNAILVRVNPAGFTLVRYILNHFEFYAQLVHNETSLFDEPLAGAKADGRFVYAFEKKIDNVLRQAHDHTVLMRKFFDTHYAALRLTGDEFSRSPYCFRHQTMRSVAQVSGQSHSISIVGSHIDYIDHFRLQLVGRKSPLPEEEAERVNQLLCDRLEKYVYVLAEAPDRHEANRLADGFIRAIDSIRKDRFQTT